MTYLIKAILHNNLAGHGPDTGEEDMRFLVSKERHGADAEDLKAGHKNKIGYFYQSIHCTTPMLDKL